MLYLSDGSSPLRVKIRDYTDNKIMAISTHTLYAVYLLNKILHIEHIKFSLFKSQYVYI